ncbi:MAG TPA: GDP-mannose 4,6-dehydratase [Gemmatimonadales bacterium]|nr:GDP-mannose 4,6-dehydratase [Gemmatimonadales bacterium]
MKVLVTGADGFVGRHLIPRLLETGHRVMAACRPGGEPPETWLDGRWRGAVEVIPLEITDSDSVRAAVDGSCDAIVHLAAIASVREASRDPGRAWTVNAAGTARLLDAAAARQGAAGRLPLVLVISTAEVYGSGPAVARRESDPLAPQSAYAASKAGAELAALEAWRRTGLPVVIARPFPHTGPGQDAQYVVPSFVQRLLAARASGSATVATGNLDPVRDLLDVRDVAEAYLSLLVKGVPGEAYNVARGEGVSLRELFRRLADLIDVRAEPSPDPSLMRGVDIPYLVGDVGKLRRATGWFPRFSLDQTLQELVNAQAH